MIASLPMYDTDATRAANDRLWALIRAHYGQGPTELDRETDPHMTWEDPTLVLSQTCGLPYRSQLHEQVTLVGTPDYGLRGCPPGYYNSCIIVRADDPRILLTDFKGATLARNDRRSQSGWAAIENHLADNNTGFSFVGHTLDTGGHVASAQAVIGGRADIAAIDAVTWAIYTRDTGEATALRVLLRTQPTPGLPFITAKETDPAPLFDAIRRAIKELDEADRKCLLLEGIVNIPASDYLSVPQPPAEI